MKVRNPKTGEVFLDIDASRKYFCKHCSNPGDCGACPVSQYKNGTSDGCVVFCMKNPREAARLMGYDVIEDEPKRNCFTCWRYNDKNFPCAIPNIDRSIGCSAWERKEDTMSEQDKPTKPRLAEVLGVDVGEKIKVMVGGYKTTWIDIPENDENLMSCECAVLIHAIYHPEHIVRAPRLTEAELAICEDMGAKWVSRENDMARFELWAKKPECKGGFYYSSTDKGDLIAVIFDDALFPSVHPGDCICVEEAGGREH